MTRYIFITGGVVSSLGKGIASASIGAILENRGLKIRMLKLDPYINVDPGTMSPFQHGEVFVTEDGAETDLDLGHYERFVRSRTGKSSNFTTGKADGLGQMTRIGLSEIEPVGTADCCKSVVKTQTADQRFR